MSETKRQRLDRLLIEKIDAVTDEWDRIRASFTERSATDEA